MLYNASIKVENSEYERYIKLGGYRGPLATSCCEPRKKRGPEGSNGNGGFGC